MWMQFALRPLPAEVWSEVLRSAIMVVLLSGLPAAERPSGRLFSVNLLFSALPGPLLVLLPIQGSLAPFLPVDILLSVASLLQALSLPALVPPGAA